MALRATYRLLAARGLLPRPAQEQIALLVVLVDDPDPDIAAIADATISRLPQEAVQELLAGDAPAEVRVFFAERAARPAVVAPEPSTPSDAQGHAEAADGQANDKTGEGDEESEEEDDGTDPRLVSTLPIASA